MQPIISTVQHQFSRNKRASALFLLCLLLIAVLSFAFFDTEPVIFQSRESKTEGNTPVFNRISYSPGWVKDVWVMQQGHHGNDGDYSNWDRIAIVVEHKEASSEFFQLTPGPRDFDEQDVVPKRVACFACHSNGPRAIRPDYLAMDVSVWDQLRVFLWNLRIKSYGPVDAKKQKHDADFRLQMGIANDRLQVRACTRCHNDSDRFGRGTLTRQNASMIYFVLREGLMPPLGFSLSEEEKKDVRLFIGIGKI